MNNLKLVAMQIAEGCNLNCSFCVRNANSNIVEKIDIEHYKKFLSTLNNLPKKPMIAITGGEPFIHNELTKIVKMTIDNGFRFSINTNGTIENSEVFSICENTNLFINFIISLDSYKEVIHNEIRGDKYAYKKTMQFIATLKKHNLPFSINMTINEKNIDDISKTIELAKEIGAINISIATVKPSGRGTASLDLKQLKSMAKQVIANQYLICNEFKLYVAEATFFLYDMINYEESILKGESWSCAFGSETLHIKSNGDILGCTTCDKVLGNIFTQENFDLSDFWNQNEVLNKVRSKKYLTGICGECKYLSFCGGCRCRAYALTNNLFGDDLYCPIIMNSSDNKEGSLNYNLQIEL